MGSEWRELTIGEIAAQDGHGLVDGPFGSNLPASSYTNQGVPVIRGSNLTLGLGRFNSQEFVYVSNETANKLSRSLCRPDDIIFTKKGTLGQTGLVPKNEHAVYLISSNQMKLTVDTKTALPLYVYYYVSSPDSTAKIIRDSESTGVPKTNLTYLKEFPIRLPDLNLQQKIADMLGSLDDKIELNNQINTTLESMAQALFKSWFVDFDPVIDNAIACGNPIPDELSDRAERRRALKQNPNSHFQPLPTEIQQLFPSSFVLTEEMGWVPEGWEIKRIDDLLELAYGKSLPATVRMDGSVPVYGSGGVSGYHNESMVNGPGIVVGRKGTVGSLYWVEEDFFPIDTVFYVQSKSDIPIYWLFQILQTLDIASMGADSAVPGVNRNAVYAQKVIVPRINLLKAYDRLICSYKSKQKLVIHQNNVLSALRDNLLPKLLSGQIQIPEADALLNESL